MYYVVLCFIGNYNALKRFFTLAFFVYFLYYKIKHYQNTYFSVKL